MKTINEIVKYFSNYDEQIEKLYVQNSEYHKLLNDLLQKNKNTIINFNSDFCDKAINLLIIDNYKINDIIEKIEEIDKKITELIEFKSLQKDWEGGKCPGDIIDTPDGCRIRFDEQSRSFKFQNYKNSATTIVCETKEECYEKAKKYLYDYYNKLGKISNQYKYFHPKYIQVKLPNGEIFITDSKNIDIIEKNKISSKYERKYDNHYVMYLSGNKEHSLFYKLITKYSRVKYINENTLDLREENMEESDNSILAKIKDGETELDIDKNNNIVKPKLNKDGYPYNTWILGKYSGTVFQRKSRNNWSVVVKKEDGTVVTKTLTFNETNKDELYKKAIETKNELSDKYDLTRNKIRIINDDTIEVQLTKDQIMKTDYKYIELVQKYNIYSTKSNGVDSKYYAVIDIDNKLNKFHKHITGFEMVDHIDRDTLNNCLKNLRDATPKINNNNRSKSNNSGAEVLGVSYNEKEGYFRARIKQDDIEYSKQFSVKKYGYEEAKQMAIQARKEYNELFGCNNG